MTPQMRKWVQSVHQALTQGVDMGTPAPNGTVPVGDPVNSGVFSQFEKGNGSGVLVRIAGTGANGNAPWRWPSSGALQIQHGLLRQPIGFIVADKDKTCDIWRTAPPTKDFIKLQCSDNTASVTVYIF
jgi:hypothetical protein